MKNLKRQRLDSMLAYELDTVRFLSRSVQMSVHFLSGFYQTFVRLRICMPLLSATNLASKETYVLLHYEEKKFCTHHYYPCFGTTHSNGYLDLC